MSAQDKPENKKSAVGGDAGGAVWRAMRDALNKVTDDLHADDVPAARLLETWLQEDAARPPDDSWTRLKTALDADRPADAKLFP